MNRKYDQELISLIKSLAEDGLSGHEISAKLGELKGLNISCSSVTSLCGRNRIRLKGRRPNRYGVKKSGSSALVNMRKNPTPEIPEATETQSEKKKVSPGECQWPHGDPKKKNFHYCGDTTVKGRPYCHKHCDQAYAPRPARTA